MSGTAFCTVILHVAPEAAVGGPLALAMTGDYIRVSVCEKRVDLLVDESELSRRRASVKKRPLPGRDWAALYARTVQQANLGY